MKKIKYRIVYNRKKQLDNQGKALVQIEAYLSGRKSYFPLIFTSSLINGTLEHH